MTREDQTALWMLAGIWILSKYEWSVSPALERGGARLWEWAHDAKPDHSEDLPGARLTKAKLLDLTTKAGFTDPRMASAIIMAESGGHPGALGDGGKSVGLFQINTRAWPTYDKQRLKDPWYNAWAAWQISRGGTNWKHWSTYKTAKYRRYL